MAKFTYTGNEVKVVLDGIEAALVQNIRGGDSYGHEAASGIGDIHVKEHVPSMARHTISVDKMLFKPEKLIEAGIVYENGDEALEGREFTIEIFTLDGVLLKKWERCVCDSVNVSVQKHAIVMTDAQFLGIDTKGKLAA